MKLFNLVAAAALTAATVAPAMAQSSQAFPSQPPPPPRHRPLVGRPGPDQPNGGSPGYQANTYVRRPSALTPTDVGNMAFPSPGQTPEGDLPATPVGR